MRHIRIVAAACVALVALSCDGGPTEPATPVADLVVTGIPVQNSLLVGASAQLSAVPRDAGGAALERRVSWASSDASIASVSPTGLVTGVASGIALIRASAGGQTQEVPIAVLVSVPVPPATASAPVTTGFFGNTLSLTIPPGATMETSLTVGRVRVITDDTRILTATAFAIGPATATFSAPLTVEVSVNLVGLSTTKRNGIRLYRISADGNLTPIAASAVDAARSVLVSPITQGGSYVAVVPGDPAQVAAAEGDSRRVPVNDSVPGIAVVVRDAAGNPVPGVAIEFSPEGSGNGIIVGDTIAFTDIEGRADLPGQWIPSATSGTYFLRASVIGTSLAVRFTALTFVPAVAVRFDAAPTTGISGVMLTDPFIITLVDANGNRADETRDVTLNLIGGSGTVTGPMSGVAAGGGLILTGQTITGGGSYRMVVSSAGLRPDTSDVIEVTQRVRSLRMLTEPAGAMSSVPFTTQPVVELLDDVGLRVTGGTHRVQARTQTGVLLGTQIVTAVNGVATFTDLAIEGVGSTSLIFDAIDAQGSSNVFSATLDVTPFQGIQFRVGAVPVFDVTPGTNFGPFLQVDLSNRNDANIAALDVTITWDPARVGYVSRNSEFWRDSTGMPANVTVDDSRVAEGILRISGSTPGATTSSFDLPGLIMTALPTATEVSTTITAVINAATNAAGAPVTIVVRPALVRIFPSP